MDILLRQSLCWKWWFREMSVLPTVIEYGGWTHLNTSSVWPSSLVEALRLTFRIEFSICR